MLLCHNHGHSEGWRAWLQLLKYGNLYDNITLSRCPDYSFATLYCNKYLSMVLLLNGVANDFHDISPPWAGQFSAWRSLAAKWTTHGSHSWSVGPSTATQFAVVGQGDQLWRGTTCGVRGHEDCILQDSEKMESDDEVEEESTIATSFDKVSCVILCKSRVNI